MRRVAVIVLTVLAVIAAGCQPAEKPPEKPRVTIPKGQVLVPEDALSVFAGQAEVQMQAAQAALKKRDAPGAARGVRLAIGFMELEAATAKSESKKALSGATAGMEKVATSLEKGEVVNSADASAAFAGAQHALARHHTQKAAGAVASGDGAKVRHRLGAAAASAEAAVKWSGGKLTTEEKAVGAAARSLADRIAQGGTWTAEEATSVLSGLEAQIDRLGAKDESAKPAGTAPAAGGK